MGYTLVAPVGDNLKALFAGIKEFPTERVILICPSAQMDEAKNLAKKLEDFTISSKIIEIKQNNMEDMFRVFGQICSVYKDEELIVNVATGDRMSTCSALSASFANGLRAFGVMQDRPFMMPIMKLSYYNELSENKLKILRALQDNEETSLNELSKKLGMSLSLLSYHINGNYKYKGLKEYRLVEIREEKKGTFVTLSAMGRLLLEGYINQNSGN